MFFLSSGATKLVGVCSWKAQALGLGTWVHKQLFGLTILKTMGLLSLKSVPLAARFLLLVDIYSTTQICELIFLDGTVLSRILYNYSDHFGEPSI